MLKNELMDEFKRVVDWRIDECRDSIISNISVFVEDNWVDCEVVSPPAIDSDLEVSLVVSEKLQNVNLENVKKAGFNHLILHFNLDALSSDKLVEIKQAGLSYSFYLPVYFNPMTGKWILPSDDNEAVFTLFRTHLDSLKLKLGDDVLNGAKSFILDYIRTPKRVDDSALHIANICIRINSEYKNYSFGAFLMPEINGNVDYGQDVGLMKDAGIESFYLMSYAGNYNKDYSWVKEVASKFNGVYPNTVFNSIIQCYNSDDDPKPIPTLDLYNELNQGLWGAANGTGAFRAGLINLDPENPYDPLEDYEPSEPVKPPVINPPEENDNMNDTPKYTNDVSKVFDYRVYMKSFKDIQTRNDNYVNVHGSKPERIAVRNLEANEGFNGDYITYNCYSDMLSRYQGWKDTHNGVEPAFVVTYKLPDDGSKDHVVQDKTFLQQIKDIYGDFDTYYGFAEKVLKYPTNRYEYYYNRKYSKEQIKQQVLSKNIHLNCTDSSLLWSMISNELGYDYKLYNVVCTSGGGHVRCFSAETELFVKRDDEFIHISIEDLVNSFDYHNWEIQSFNIEKRIPEWKPITNAFNTGLNEVMNVYTDNNVIRSTLDHNYYFYRHDTNKLIKSEISNLKYKLFKVLNKSYNFNKNIDYKWVFIALLVSDGHLAYRNDRTQYSIVFNLRKSSKIDYYENILKKLNVSYSKDKNGRITINKNIRGSNQTIVTPKNGDLFDFVDQIINVKNKHDTVLEVTEDNALSLFSGFISSDGSITGSKFKFSSTSKNFINSYITACKVIGVPIEKISEGRLTKSRKTLYEVGSIIPKEIYDLSLLRSHNTPTLFLENKKSNFDQGTTKYTIEKNGDLEETFNITVQDNHNFFIGNILVANCTVKGKADNSFQSVDPSAALDGESIYTIWCDTDKGSRIVDVSELNKVFGWMGDW